MCIDEPAHDNAFLMEQKWMCLVDMELLDAICHNCLISCIGVTMYRIWGSIPRADKIRLKIWSCGGVSKPRYWGLNGSLMTSSNGNIFRVTGPLCGEFTGHRWNPCKRPVTRSFHVFLICAWISGWVSNRDTADLRRHRAHFDVTVIQLMV